VGPSDAEHGFLQSHITGFSEGVGATLRGKLSTGVIAGLELRLDGSETWTRTVDLPQDGRPGKLTYTIGNDLTPSAKAKLSPNLGDYIEVGYTANNLMDLGPVRSEISLSWTLGKSGGTGQDHPELNLFHDGRTLHPDEGSAADDLDGDAAPARSRVLGAAPPLSRRPARPPQTVPRILAHRFLGEN
jgi:hypothetical protein